MYLPLWARKYSEGLVCCICKHFAAHADKGQRVVDGIVGLTLYVCVFVYIYVCVGLYIYINKK
jgi:hypothetical protein